MTALAPQPGMIGLTQISGEVGSAIRVGQFLNHDGFSEWEHAFTLLPGNRILEAEPGGSRVVPLRYSNVYWCWGIYGKVLPLWAKNPGNYDRLEMVAEQLKHVPYSFLDYGSLTLHHFGINPPGLRNYIRDSGHQICSQLADDFYMRLGAQVFTDKRWQGDVTPGALWKRDLELARA